MIQSVSITIAPEKEGDEAFIRQEVLRSVRRQGVAVNPNEVDIVLQKKSIDARHGRLRYVMRYSVYSGEKAPAPQDILPVWHRADGKKRVVIVGSGPAGIFGAFTLLENGVQPIIIERGSPVAERKRDIAAISTMGRLDADSNYCFGEGGAGTFSDGKLYTRSDKRGNKEKILRMFVHFGADRSTLTDTHPHIGTDRLPAIVRAMRQELCALGAEFHFDSRCTDFLLGQEADGSRNVQGVCIRHTKTGEERTILADAVVLATGHSATDIYNLLARLAPEALEAKPFAVGVRVEHPRALIDGIQYHGRSAQGLGAAEYRLRFQYGGRGVYSFCMCPGGFVVPSASAPEQLVINGMSAAGRNSAWSNAAIVMETRPEHIPASYRRQAHDSGCSARAGLLWREALEHDTYLHGAGQQAPAQRLVDFLTGKDSASLPPSSYAPGLVASRLDAWLPHDLVEGLRTAFPAFGRSMKGFVCNEALLIASETRTSTPVRIVRQAESGECVALKRLYPAGEGSGYSGGIVSSAMDGEKICALVCRRLACQ